VNYVKCDNSKVVDMGLIKLIRNVEVYGPKYLGRKDVLIVGEKIGFIDEHMQVQVPEVEVYDGDGMVAIPGLIDSHVHFTGGGGEGGFSTRTPELKISDCIENGITTLVGCLGTDGVTRGLENLYAKSKAMEQAGVTTYIYTGSYRVPPVTFTGSVQRDLVLIDKVIGVGEIAISDHRSSQPTLEEILRIVADARVGGMIAGKCGVVNFHVGGGRNGIGYLFDIIRETEIPHQHLYPTHMSRNKTLFESGLHFAQEGGFIDLTGVQPDEQLKKEDFTAIDGIVEAYENGLIDRITISSDGQGSLPRFDKEGNFTGLNVGSVGAVMYTLMKTVEKGISPSEVLKIATVNTANVLKLEGKGRIAVGYDADIVLMRDWQVNTVLCRGKFAMKDGEIRDLNFE
jgi:beta-aspartyl-dipeptidase (metallo-type)